MARAHHGLPLPSVSPTARRGRSRVNGSALGQWVRCEAAVGSDVRKDLLYQGEHMGVVDGVDVAAAVSASTDQSGQAQLAQMLAHGGNTDAGAFCQGADVVDVLGGKP
jgi:hypothetical protein